MALKEEIPIYEQTPATLSEAEYWGRRNAREVQLYLLKKALLEQQLEKGSSQKAHTSHEWVMPCVENGCLILPSQSSVESLV